MRRVLLVTAAALALAGCQSVSTLWDGSPATGFPPDAPVRASLNMPAGTSAETAAYCDKVAVGRAQDVAAQGFDEAMQQTVHDQAYADCLKWVTRR